MTRRAGGPANLRVVAATSFLAGLSSSMMQAVWQPFVLSLGAPMGTLGLLESIGGWRGVLTAPIQHLGGWFSDRVGRKPLMALGSVTDLIAVSLYVLASITGNWRWLLPGVILLGASMISSPAQNSLVADSAQIGQRGMAYSILMTSWIAPGIFAPALSGFAADRWGFTPLLLMRIGLGGLSLLLVLLLLRETVSQGEPGVSRREPGPPLIEAILPPRDRREHPEADRLSRLSCHR